MQRSEEQGRDTSPSPLQGCRPAFVLVGLPPRNLQVDLYRLDRASDPKTFDEKEENIRQATAAAVAVSILKAKATESSPGN